MQNIKHFASSSYHPQTNGMVERMHAMLGQALTKLCNGEPKRWDEYLPQVIFSLRVRTHNVTKKSPFYLLYGLNPKLPGDPSPPPSYLTDLDSEEAEHARNLMSAKILDELGQARAAAYFRSKQQAEKMAKRNGDELQLKKNTYQINDWVKVKNPIAGKFEYQWKGPFYIKGYGPSGTYYLMDAQGRSYDTPFNHELLAPWIDQRLNTPDVQVQAKETHFKRKPVLVPIPGSEEM